MNRTEYQLSHGEKLVNFPNGIPGKGSVRAGFTWLLVGTDDAYRVVAELNEDDLPEYIASSCYHYEHLLPLAEHGAYIVVQCYDEIPEKLITADDQDKFTDRAYFGGSCWL